MRIWTYDDMNKKVQRDLDLEGETFIGADEMIGYYNEALNEAESEIMVLNQDYLLTKYFMPVVQGTSRYNLPSNIYANKIRAIMYANGSIIYPVGQYRRRGKFVDMAFTDTYGQPDDYRYILSNDVPGQAVVEFHPVMRETAVLAGTLFTPLTMWFIRNCARIPLTGEYCNPEVIATSQVSISTDVIQTNAGSINLGIVTQGVAGAYPGSLAYVTGDAVQFQVGPGGNLPSPLVVGTTYYVIQTGSGAIKLATTLLNAVSGTAIDLTTVGTVYFTMQVAATTAIQKATLIDIPEFSTFLMQWVKCRCLEKESDPRLTGAVNVLGQQKTQMIETLVKSIDDDDDKIQGDFSTYEEMS